MKLNNMIEHMPITRKSAYQAMFAALLIAVLWLYWQAASHYDLQNGYIYCSSTDELFQIDLSRNVIPYTRSFSNIVFKSHKFTQIQSFRLKTKLADWLKTDHEMKDDPRAYLEKLTKKTDEFIKRMNRKVSAPLTPEEQLRIFYNSSSAKYLARYDVDPKDLVPKWLHTALDKLSVWTNSEIFPVDLILALPSYRPDGPKVELRQQCLLFKGGAAKGVATILAGHIDLPKIAR